MKKRNIKKKEQMKERRKIKINPAYPNHAKYIENYKKHAATKKKKEEKRKKEKKTKT